VAGDVSALFIDDTIASRVKNQESRAKKREISWQFAVKALLRSRNQEISWQFAVKAWLRSKSQEARVKKQ